MPEQVRHGLLVVDSPHRFGEEGANVHRLNLAALHLLYFVWDRIRYYHLAKRMYMYAI